jgi:hydrogenase nickel incorporation protein HypA/HybF
MHELALIGTITKIAINHAEAHKASRILRIKTRIGEFTDFQEEWVQRYFDYASKGTLAEGAVLEIEWSPVIFRCEECSKVFPVKIREQRDIVCPSCDGAKVTLLSGREFIIKAIEVT